MFIVFLLKSTRFSIDLRIRQAQVKVPVTLKRESVHVTLVSPVTDVEGCLVQIIVLVMDNV